METEEQVLTEDEILVRMVEAGTGLRPMSDQELSRFVVANFPRKGLPNCAELMLMEMCHRLDPEADPEAEVLRCGSRPS